MGAHRPLHNTHKPHRVEKPKPKVVESVYFIPHTPGSELRRKLTQMEAGLNLTGVVKYVEELGPSLSEELVTKDPWAKDGCGRERCLPCRVDRGKGKCMRQGVVYTLSCTTCRAGGAKATYYGESSRTAYDRGREHAYSMERGDQNHPLVAHYVVDHPGVEVDTEMKVISYQEKPLYRQVLEGVLIRDSKEEKILNAKGEWGQNLPPSWRLRMMGGAGERGRPLSTQRGRTGKEGAGVHHLHHLHHHLGHHLQHPL